MPIKFYLKSTLLFIIVGFVVGTENYIDYSDEIPEKMPIENIHELYRLLVQRNALENARLGETPLEHLMIRKSQRSPSLRLRFGRSDPHLSIGILPKPMNAIPSSRFDDK
ncbi:short neuropeptide F-like isoform X1 [Apis florea]|uniref:short neuropeptide F-like isoform X1 n=1 Tax=Apis florea TaxID=7463 RepID=UPI000252BB44|nr:short neuropeptide F-like isoform X1 [Apis florea]